MREAAHQLLDDRGKARAAGLSPPGQAEYLDMLRALATLAPQDPARQHDLLARIGRFVMKKSAALLDA
jgi:hypothetical protein